jgi:hypothetical protein
MNTLLGNSRFLLRTNHLHCIGCDFQDLIKNVTVRTHAVIYLFNRYGIDTRNPSGNAG